MQISDFLALSLGSLVYNKKDKDIRRTASSQFVLSRLDQYLKDGVVMWTRPAFGEGWGRDIPLGECDDWEPLPLNVWEISDQEIINRYIVQQQRHLIDLLSDRYIQVARRL